MIPFLQIGKQKYKFLKVVSKNKRDTLLKHRLAYTYRFKPLTQGQFALYVSNCSYNVGAEKRVPLKKSPKNIYT